MAFIPTFVAFLLRFINLGYSDYQGDEIKAFFLPTTGQRATEFLLDQRKGPVQFLITAFLKIFNPSYDNQLLMRLPFALAGTLAVYFFYKLVKIHFGKKIAFYSAFFIATNGFFIAFSRIVQYQSFVIFFAILALYCFTLAITKEKWIIRGIYLGFIFWSLSILSHYDGVFIAPFALFILSKWYKEINIEKKKKQTHFAGAILSGGLLLALFYIPFILSISQATKDYWLGRLEGVGGKISSSRYLFSVYQPIYVLHIYTILSILGIIKSLMFKKTNLLAVLLWFLLPFSFMELLVEVPGTHIFNYLLPLTVIMGFGINFIEDFLKRFLGWFKTNALLIPGIFIIFVFLFLQASAIFLDHSREYPWESEQFLLWEFPKPTPIFHLSMFGFPYFRHWEAIGEVVRTTENNGYYSTNERSTISRYYIPLKKSSDDAGFFILIKNPQSFTEQPVNERVRLWIDSHAPVISFTDANGRPVTEIYYLTQ